MGIVDHINVLPILEEKEDITLLAITRQTGKHVILIELVHLIIHHMALPHLCSVLFHLQRQFHHTCMVLHRRIWDHHHFHHHHLEECLPHEDLLLLLDLQFSHPHQEQCH